MEKLNKILTQEEYEMLTSELMVLKAEEKFDGKDNTIRIKEIKNIIEN